MTPNMPIGSLVSFLLRSVATSSTLIVDPFLSHMQPLRQPSQASRSKWNRPRSKYIPGGAYRNCGEYGISPKSVMRRRGYRTLEELREGRRPR